MSEFTQDLAADNRQFGGLAGLFRQIEYHTRLLQTMKREEIEIFKQRSAEDNYHSNAIEGSRVTFEETKEILAGLGDTISKYHQKEKAEITDYASAQIFMLERCAKKAPLDELLMIDMHYELMRVNAPIFAGHVRCFGEEVTAGGKDVGYTLGEDVDSEIENLFNWFSTFKQYTLSAVEVFKLAVEFKYRFLRIHPFSDGNGRLSRLLMNYILLLNRMFPLVITVEDREEYMNAVIATQREDDLRHYYTALANMYVRELVEYGRTRAPRF